VDQPTTNTIPTVYVDKRKAHRQLANAQAIIKREVPPLPTRLSVYTKDLTSGGCCFLVTDSIVWSVGDLISITFIIEMDKSKVARSNLLKLHRRKGMVCWSQNGRIGVQFLRDAEGKVWTF